MTTLEEIRRRVEQADTARSTKRSAVAQQVGELAQRRAVIAKQLNDIERQLGDVLAGAQDVIDIPELARFTNTPAADLTRWLAARKTTRTKRKQHSDTSQGLSAATTPTAGQASTVPEPASAADVPTRVTAGVA